MEEQFISLHNLTIGKVLLDPADIRGEGGWYDPRLVVPIKINLNAQPEGREIIIVRLTASLHLDKATGQGNQFGVRINYDPILNMRLRSPAEGTSDDDLALHFNLTHEHIKLLEDMRHQPGKNLYLELEPIIVWNKHTGNEAKYIQGQRVISPQDGGWSTNVGLFSDFAYFWQATIRMLPLEFVKMKWAESIFPGVGFDRFRLLEIALPSSSTLVPDNAITLFENARKDYDSANYNGCVEKCREVIECLEQHLAVPAHQHTLGTAVARELHWPPSPGGRPIDHEAFLNHACKAYFALTSMAHHYPSSVSLLPADAHTSLLSIATLLEYLGQLQ